MASSLAWLPWYAWIALAAIFTGFFSGVLQMHYKHVERIEMIRHGINPDEPEALAKPMGVEEF